MDLITKFLTLHNQLKVYHWQTESYAQHQAFGGAYDAFTGYIDQFLEEFMGKNARIMAKGGFKVELPKQLKPEDTNLLNIRDEMLGELQKLKYLLTLD